MSTRRRCRISTGVASGDPPGTTLARGPVQDGNNIAAHPLALRRANSTLSIRSPIVRKA
jgi:hypothetical protein